MKKMNALSVLLHKFIGRSKLTVDNSVVTKFVLNSFLGSWYEIARFNHRFERGMEHTKANYVLRKDGKVDILNTGMRNGKYSEAKGIAKLTDIPSLLSFSFWRPFYSDYRIMLIDDYYQYALVGSGSDEYLWILARTPRISDEVKDKILAEAQRRGYETDNIIWVRQ